MPKDNIPRLYQKSQLPELQNKGKKFISLFGKPFLVTLETWIKFTVLFYSQLFENNETYCESSLS